MEVFITSKMAFDKLMEQNNITNKNVESKTKVFFISINDTCGTDEKPYFENKSNVLVLFFDDVEKDMDIPHVGTDEIYHIKAISSKQAEQIIDFIELNKDKSTCIVHCAAGISRSGAVGTFVNDYFNGDYLEFKKRNPYIHPNITVLDKLHEAQGKNLFK